MRRLLLAIAGLAALTPAVMAQDETPSQVWGQLFGTAIRATFPGAESQPRRLPPRFRADLQHWEYQGLEISLTFTELESDSEAEKFLAQRTDLIPLPRRPVTGFGDQAFVFYSGVTVTASRRMNLRRRSIVLEIGAPDESALSRLALALVDVIDREGQARK